MSRDFLVRAEPDAVMAPNVGDQAFKDSHTRPMADDMRMHGDQAKSFFRIGAVELCFKNIEHVKGDVWGRMVLRRSILI